MRIFLTGATGYIGSAVAEALAGAGYDVVGLARSDAAARHLEKNGYGVHRGDLKDPTALAEAAGQAEAVVHCAATGDAEMGALDRQAVTALLEALEGTGNAFLYTSGVWVLGDTGDRVADEEAPVEAADLVAWRPAVERQVLEARGVRGTVIRPALVYGRGGGIPAMLVQSGIERGAVRYFGDGAQRWPTVHVDDLADLYVRALDAPAGTVLHASAGPAYRAADVAAAAGHVAGVDRTDAWPLEEAREEVGPFADALALDQRISSKVAREAFGWRPQALSILDDLRHGSYAGREHAHHICVTCGTQFAATDGPPDRCPICEDERQFVGWEGQQWTTLAQVRRDHHNVIRPREPGLTGIVTEPKFGIGQRALLVETPEGNVLWDCVTLLDEKTQQAIEDRGGIDAIAISHPHFYSSMIEWSRAFDDAPIYLAAANRPWVMRPDENVVFWEGPTQELFGGLTLIRTGGHFEGSTALHWPGGAGGRGALLAGDSLKVTMDRQFVSFMYSYPNITPLDADTVERIARAVAPFAFDRIYGAAAGTPSFGHVIRTGAKEVIRRSVARYVEAVEGTAAGAEVAVEAAS